MKSWADETIIGGLMLFLVAAIGVLIYVAAVSPSCEDQGKRSVFLYFMPMVTMAGNVPVTNLMPVYGCQ